MLAVEATGAFRSSVMGGRRSGRRARGGPEGDAERLDATAQVRARPGEGRRDAGELVEGEGHAERAVAGATLVEAGVDLARLDAEGGVRARGYAELPQHYPQPGWVEHDPAQIWATTVQALGQAVAAAGITPAEIAAKRGLTVEEIVG